MLPTIEQLKDLIDIAKNSCKEKVCDECSLQSTKKCCILWSSGSYRPSADNAKNFIREIIEHRRKK